MIRLPRLKGRKVGFPMPLPSPETLNQQLSKQRRTVDFDTFDIQVQELLRRLEDGEISIAPVYQRQFRWDDGRCSELIESLMLGIPIPNLFMATNADNTWEVVDGVQRLSTIVKFVGSDELRKKLKVGDALTLGELRKLSEFNGMKFEDIPPTIQLHLRTRPLKVVTLNDKSDTIVRIDLFERLNTGGVELTNQEIRDCVFHGKFADLLEDLAVVDDFKTAVKLTAKQQSDGTAKECVLRFFAFFDKYKKFDHGVKEFLDDYMRVSVRRFDHENRASQFRSVFEELAAVFPNGILRRGGKGTTPLNLYEGVAVGAAFALKKVPHLNAQHLDAWMSSPELRQYTTGATNDRRFVRGRIEFCRDRFMGKPYVPRLEF